MKLIYDISVLGLASYNLRNRTGIARVIEHVALGLKRSGNCDMNFCAYHQLQDHLLCRRYLQTMPELKSVPLIEPPSAKINRYARVADRLYPAPSDRKSTRIIRKILGVLLNNVGAGHDMINIPALASADVFHATFYEIPSVTRTFSRLRKFVTIYDLIPVLFPQYFNQKGEHLLNRVLKSIAQDDWVITISESTKNDLCDYLKFDPARVFVAHLAASDLFHPCTNPDELASARKNYRIPDGPYVLSLCTLEPRKNIDFTIRCFSRLVEEENIADLNLVLVGTKGWDFDTIFKELSHNKKLRERIIVTGFVADEDLAAIYSNASMFVYPSFYEGFGLPPLEAMQCGVPVITSNTSSLPEVVGGAGLMVDPRDGDALCQAMLDVYRRPLLREELSRKSIERARAFSWDACTEATVRAYQTALGGPQT